jgi:DNA-directed RNA polymerase sigma subunit (sigma70/sigma32)
MKKLLDKVNKQEKEIRNLEIKALYLGGKTMQEIAEEKDITKVRVSQIINKKNK